jgi:hypothetical protein
MNLEMIEKLAVITINKHLTGWSFEWNNRVRAYGVCDYEKKTIYLSRVLTSTRTIEEVKETIAHEIAHALCPGHHHNSVWAAKSMELGGSGERCGRGGDTPPYTWVMEHEGRVVKGYYRKPTVALRKLPTTFLTGKKAETIGRLTIRKVA